LTVHGPLEFKVQNYPLHLASGPFNPGRLLLVEAIDGSVVTGFAGLHKAVIDRLTRLRVLGPAGFEKAVSGVGEGEIGSLIR
jgi:hypothetical protein